MNRDGRGGNVAQRNRMLCGCHKGKWWCEHGLLLISRGSGPKKQVRYVSDPYMFKGMIDSIDGYVKM